MQFEEEERLSVDVSGRDHAQNLLKEQERFLMYAAHSLSSSKKGQPCIAHENDSRYNNSTPGLSHILLLLDHSLISIGIYEPVSIVQ